MFFFLLCVGVCVVVCGGVGCVCVWGVWGVCVCAPSYGAAFDHKILVDCLENRYAISGTAKDWLESYLKGWASQVSIFGTLSDPVTLKYGVPQGSVLGPLLFTCYSNPIGDIVGSYHVYADDRQIYASFDPRVPDDTWKTLLPKLLNALLKSGQLQEMAFGQLPQTRCL